jgi:hypothetical protein
VECGGGGCLASSGRGERRTRRVKQDQEIDQGEEVASERVMKKNKKNEDEEKKKRRRFV